MTFVTILLILGTLGLIINKLIKSDSESVLFKKWINGISFAIFVIATIVLLFRSFNSVPSGTAGVVSTFSKIEDKERYPGLTMIWPWQTLSFVNTKTQSMYTASGTNEDESSTMKVLSKDGLEIDIDQSILFKIFDQDASEILRNLGPNYKDIIVSFQRSITREESSKYTAIELYSTKREAYQAKVFELMKIALGARKIQLEEVLIRGIGLPPSVKASIEAKINAEQDAQKMDFVLAKEKQEAERKRIEAAGIRDYQQIITQNASELTIKLKTLETMEHLKDSPNTKYFFFGNKDGVPFLIN